MARQGAGRDRQVINLISDDEKDEPADNGIDHAANSLREFVAPWLIEHPVGDHIQADLDEHQGQIDVEVNNADIFDLTAIPNIGVPPPDRDLHSPEMMEGGQPAAAVIAPELITEAVCLQLVLDVFPDVSVDHVLEMIQLSTTDLTRTKKHSERIVNELLERTYPKEADMTTRKRRREDSDGASEYEKDERDDPMLTYHPDA